jgi:hypothetical protein
MLSATPNPNGPPVDPKLAWADARPVPPETIRVLRVLVAHFPEWLKKHDGKWVACDENGFLFAGKSWDAIFKRCLKRGLKPEEFVIEYMMPGALHALDMDSLRDPT